MLPKDTFSMRLPSKRVWVINNGDEQVDWIELSLKKQIILKPKIPQQFELNLGLKIVNKYKNVSICTNPEEYFKSRKMEKLIIRDAGIGDLLMLEPIMRKMGENNNFNISIATMYPEVFENTPYIKNIHKLDNKENIEDINMSQYDTWDDIRNYSETSPLRNTTHRTDIYNELFNLPLSEEEKQPRLYFKKNEKSILKKQEGKIYIGIQCDASHSYRRYDRANDLIEYILKKNRKYIVVLLGSYDFVKKYPMNKRIIDLQGQTSRRQAICIVRDLDYLIAADSGLMHVALTCHTPVVCMFSIITPDFRVRYYKGHYRVIWKDIPCKGCGDFHMVECKHGSKKNDIEYLAPCMNIEPELIYSKMIEMPINYEKRIFYGTPKVKENGNGNKDIVNKEINIISTPITKKLTMPIIVQNEEKNLHRFIDNVIKHPAIGRVIAIDGGSNDKTVKILESAGVNVYTHSYIKEYHEQQAMQRNISCSYVKQGEKIIIMDIDECFSKDLSDYLPVLAESDIEYGLISRRTFDYYADIGYPSKQIKDYPDYQPRFYTWDRKFKFVGGAHHITLNTPEPVLINKDIIHFEKEGKDRDALERQWAGMMSKVRQYA